MVQDTLWSVHGVGSAVLCLRCFEGRMGRRVTVHDLMICEATLSHPRLLRMVERAMDRWR